MAEQQIMRMLCTFFGSSPFFPSASSKLPAHIMSSVLTLAGDENKLCNHSYQMRVKEAENHAAYG